MQALIVAAAPCSAEGIEFLAVLARDADIVIAADGGADHCRAAGIEPTAIVGDMDSVDPEELALAQSEIDRHPTEKDASDLDLALERARELGATEIVLTCALGGRLDHTLANIGSLRLVADLAPRIVEPNVVAWLLDAASAPTFDAETPGCRISLLAPFGPATISIRGVRWPLESVTLQPLSSLGLSNVVLEDRARLDVENGALLVIVDART